MEPDNEQNKGQEELDAYFKQEGYEPLLPGEMPEPYEQHNTNDVLTIEKMINLDPNTITRSLCLIGSIQDRVTMRQFALQRVKTTSFNDIIYRNAQWIVRGDATVENSRYQCDGDDILDGMEGNGKLHNTWPYHVCQKPWVIPALFCDAYCIAYYHKQMTLARAALAQEE